MPTPTEQEFARVLAQVLQVDSVPADGHFFEDLGADSMLMARFCARVRKHPDLPSVSMKEVYEHPTIRDLATALAPAPPPAPATAGPVESGLAEVLSAVVDRPVTPDSHFFEDLGADSMLMARFCARVRKHPDLPSVSMKEVYEHPTIRGLATALAPAPAAAVAPAPAPVPAPIPIPEPANGAPPAGALRYALVGLLQLLAFLAYSGVVAVVASTGFDWISDGHDLVSEYLRAVVFGGLTLLGIIVTPIVAKWVLIGRWTPREIPVWSLAYVRFWVVKTLVRVNPLVLLFGGSPIHVLYLRALGARIGRGVTILAKQVPVATDLLTIGDHTVVRRESALPGYRAHAGHIQIGPVTIGRDVLVGEATVLDIDTSIGDGAQLGLRSTLQRGQAVPAGEHWHGNPARRTDVDYRVVPPATCGTRRRVVYSLWQVLTVCLVTLPLGIGGIAMLLLAWPEIGALLDAGPLAFTDPSFYLHAAEVSAVLSLGSVLVGLLLATTLPRVLNLAIDPDRVYPLYGFHYALHRGITRLTNRKALTGLFGDSSYIVHYLQWIGYDLSEVEQTGSNFGTNVTHESPYHVTVGTGTMVADGLTVANADYSATSFRVSRATIGPRSFLGNGIIYPPQSRMGENCLLATKVQLPVEGPVRNDVGLLGSPAFEIPRSVERDGTFDHYKGEQELPGRLAAKNGYNLRTIALVLLVRWASYLGFTLLGLAAADLHHSLGAGSVFAAELGAVLFTIGFGVFVERANLRFGRLRPQFCSIYEPYFWWHERYWKLLWNPALFNGTPMKGLMWRLVGVRVGRRLFDDGADIPERTLVTIGDDCTLNAATWLQAHSQEDGAFKSDTITLGNGVTVGLAAWTHYGVVLGDGAVLAADSFLMKGEEIPAGEHWGGNPAQELPEVPAALPAATPRPLPAAALPPPRTEPILQASSGRASARPLTPTPR
ncbi:Pls/PosA family non-ribosomal peptide synthetase [Geodermatophilus sabuli]|uniref:Pls/PosA family non-ribosomal peptide synthetase n=1 Tax=Geodermatophilus sabuli TaxID=1564158 RepID=UPI0015593DC3|nr:Pls/PosA family non-ribosomal peptide synthetase [Geodermatophilus sabuli]